MRYLTDNVRSPVKARLNLMVPKPPSGRQLEPRLQLVCADYLNDFTNQERRDRWGKGEGNCGVAWETGETQVFASDISGRKTRFKDMGRKSKAAQGLVSVLSIPVKSKDERVIAILNMDSNHGGEDTFIHQDGVIFMFEKGAEEIASLLSKI